MLMKKVLISGFEPFGGASVNPALEAVQQLAGRNLAGGVIVTCTVPVVRFKAIEAVVAAIEAERPDYVITVGQAAGRTGITPERVAINVDDFRIPDNEGIQVVDEPIVAGAPDAYFTTLPIKAMVRAMQDQGIPAQVSNTAGTFVCNHLFYGIQNYIQQLPAPRRIGHGFVHIPLLPEQTTDSTQPSMSLPLIVAGLAICAQSAIDHPVDISVGGGAIC